MSKRGRLEARDEGNSPGTWRTGLVIGERTGPTGPVSLPKGGEHNTRCTMHAPNLDRAILQARVRVRTPPTARSATGRLSLALSTLSLGAALLNQLRGSRPAWEVALSLITRVRHQPLEALEPHGEAEEGHEKVGGSGPRCAENGPFPDPSLGYA